MGFRPANNETQNEPNVAAEWTELSFRVREIPNSNLGPEIAYLE
jgi:hypothetical protein